METIRLAHLKGVCRKQRALFRRIFPHPRYIGDAMIAMAAPIRMVAFAAIIVLLLSLAKKEARNG